MKFLGLIKLVCIVTTLFFSVAGAQEDKKEFQRFSLVPVIGYTEETRLQYGAMFLLFLKPDQAGEKVPEIGLTVFGTTRNQMQVNVEPFFYLFHDKISVWSNIRYQNWFASYFGSGNDPDIDIYTNFDRQRFYLESTWESAIGMPNGLKYGVIVHAENSQIDFNEDGNISDLPDSHSGWRNGIGYTLSYDSRDNINWSKRGFLVQWQQLFYSDKLGDYTFNVESVDIRGYAPLPWGTSFAQGILWQRAAGDVPFDKLAGPDGVKRFRGVESLFFNGNQAVITQSEVRKYFAYRVGAHLFFESGKAGKYFSQMWRNKWHKSIGAGALFALNLSEDLFARADVSWVDFDHIGISFNVRQAF